MRGGGGEGGGGVGGGNGGGVSIASVFSEIHLTCGFVGFACLFIFYLFYCSIL
jgi:hypothetical protein